MRIASSLPLGDGAPRFCGHFRRRWLPAAVAEPITAPRVPALPAERMAIGGIRETRDRRRPLDSAASSTEGRLGPTAPPGSEALPSGDDDVSRLAVEIPRSRPGSTGAPRRGRRCSRRGTIGVTGPSADAVRWRTDPLPDLSIQHHPAPATRSGPGPSRQPQRRCRRPPSPAMESWTLHPVLPTEP